MLTDCLTDTLNYVTSFFLCSHQPKKGRMKTRKKITDNVTAFWEVMTHFHGSRQRME
jgi:hypothetical protein